MMDIVFGLDNNYAPYCGVLITSICENNMGQEISFHLLTNINFSDSMEVSIRKICSRYCQQLYVYKINSEKFKKFPIRKGAYLNDATYYRILMPELLPVSIQKVLYLDCDIIVRSSLSDLWNIDLQGYAVAGSIDNYTGNIKCYNRLQYDYNLGYFNCGVLLINLEYWRKHKIQNQLLEFIYNHSDRIWLEDQDVLNYVLCNCKKRIPIKYNLMEIFLIEKKDLLLPRKYWDELEEAIFSPAIIHYSNAAKPWYYECTHPYRKEWLKYMQISGFPGIKIKHLPIKRLYRHIIRKLLVDFNFIKREKYRKLSCITSNTK